MENNPARGGLLWFNLRPLRCAVFAGTHRVGDLRRSLSNTVRTLQTARRSAEIAVSPLLKPVEGSDHARTLELAPLKLEKQSGKVGAKCSDGEANILNGADFQLSNRSRVAAPSEKKAAASHRFTPTPQQRAPAPSKRGSPLPRISRSIDRICSDVGAVYCNAGAKSLSFAGFEVEQDAC